MSYKGFPKVVIEAIVCQECCGPLVSSGDAKFLLEGELKCNRCNNAFPIHEGILCLLPQQKVAAVQEKEIAARDEEADRYDKRLAKRYHKEVISTLRELGDVRGAHILEHGAGTGRLTKEYVKDAGTVVAVDFSLRSLQVFAEAINTENIALIHADAVTLRTAPEYFSLVLATQLYEHIPTILMRRQFLEHIKETLQSGGSYISTTYHYDLRMRRLKAPKEGMHPTGIFFHYFSVPEISLEIAEALQIKKIFLIDITLPFEARMKLSPSIGGYLSRIAERVPVLSLFGHLILCVAKKQR